MLAAELVDAPGRVTLGAAATPSTAALLDGPPRRWEVLHRSRHAVYAGEGRRVVAILGRGAVGVPCGLRTSLDDVSRLGERDGLVVGDGVCIADELRLAVRRLVDARVPALDPTVPLAWTPAARTAVRRRVSRDLDADPATLASLAAGMADGALTLLGRGPGLTPLGDDVVAGWLAGAASRGLRDSATHRAVRAHAHARTTAVSAALLLHAADGEAIPAVQRLLAGASPIDAALADVRAVGHTSGDGLLLGLALALSPTSGSEGER